MTTSDSVYERGYPPDQATARLAVAIKAVCPGEGASIGRWDDRATWRLDHADHATEEEIDAARAVMAAFDPWGDGADDIGELPPEDEPEAFAAPEEEDPGEQPEIFDDEELEGGDADSSPPATDDAGPGEPNQAAGAADHGGVLIHYDQVEIARAQIAMKVSDHEEILVGALSNRWPDLTAAFRDTNNLAPNLWTEQQSVDRLEFMRLSQIESAIRAHAVNLRRAVKDADADQLRNIDAALSEGWPT